MADARELEEENGVAALKWEHSKWVFSKLEGFENIHDTIINCQLLKYMI